MERPITDADGRITLPALIPGALYRISDCSTMNDRDKGVQVRKDFTVKPGETLDLGDILIENPKWYVKWASYSVGTYRCPAGDSRVFRPYPRKKAAQRACPR